jgi:hypothetical protein
MHDADAEASNIFRIFWRCLDITTGYSFIHCHSSLFRPITTSIITYRFIRNRNRYPWENMSRWIIVAFTNMIVRGFPPSLRRKAADKETGDNLTGGLSGTLCSISVENSSLQIGSVSEWLRRQTRNLLCLHA